MLVGVRVMTVVLAHPPAVAQPDTQVAEQDAGDVTGPPGAEHLPVPGVMAQKPDLGEDHRQERGHRQLPPRVAHHHEGRPSGRQHPDGDRDLPGVVPRAPLQQPGLLDLPGQLCILAAAPRRERCRGQLDLPGHGNCCFGGCTGNSWEAHRGGQIMSAWVLDRENTGPVTVSCMRRRSGWGVCRNDTPPG